MGESRERKKIERERGDGLSRESSGGGGGGNGGNGGEGGELGGVS